MKPVPLRIDVTHSAEKPDQSGIPRVTRGLFGALAARPDLSVTPVIWEDPAEGYAAPCFFHQTNLRAGRPSGERRRELSRPPFWQRRWRRKTRGFRLLPRAGAGSWYLLAEVFSDRRIDWLARFRATAPGVRIAALFHDAIPLTHPELTPPQHRESFDRYASALAQCHVVFCVSRQSEADLLRFWSGRGLAAPRTVAIHLPLDASFRSLPHQAPEASVPAPGPPRLLFVATLEPRKNHLALLAACLRLWEKGIAFQLDLVGQKLSGGSEEILRAIDRLQGEGRPVVWHGKVDDATVRDLYRKALFTVFPSLKEGFGLPIIESLAYGKACVCSDAGAIAEVASPGGCLMIDVRDPDALAGGIERLLASPETRRRLEAEAAGRTFPSWPEYAAAVTRVLEDVPASAFPGRPMVLASTPAPPISLIVPNRNQRPFLPERFDSIAAQTRGDFEVIVVDGHSEDGSWEYIRERAARDPRIRILQAEPRGPYPAWNLGLREARGACIHIATADDAMDPAFLERMAAALDRHPECGIAHCGLEIVDAAGLPIAAPHDWRSLPVTQYYFGAWIDRPHVRPAPHDGVLHAAAGTVYTSINQLLIRREVFEKAGPFREDLGITADFEWGMRASLLHGVVHVPGALARWRRHRDQLTNDSANAAPQAWQAMATMIREAIAAALTVDPSLRGRIDPGRLTRPMRHQALLFDPGLDALHRALREPLLAGFDLAIRRRWKGNFHCAHIAWIRKEMRRLHIPGPLPEEETRAAQPSAG